MEQPNRDSSLPEPVYLTKEANGRLTPSSDLIQLLLDSRAGYDWPSGTGAARSQQTIIDLESVIGDRISTLSKDEAHQIIADVSDWAGNNSALSI